MLNSDNGASLYHRAAQAGGAAIAVYRQFTFAVRVLCAVCQTLA
jgi:hypothetical protein